MILEIMSAISKTIINIMTIIDAIKILNQEEESTIIEAIVIIDSNPIRIWTTWAIINRILITKRIPMSVWMIEITIQIIKTVIMIETMIITTEGTATTTNNNNKWYETKHLNKKQKIEQINILELSLKRNKQHYDKRENS